MLSRLCGMTPADALKPAYVQECFKTHTSASILADLRNVEGARDASSIEVVVPLLKLMGAAV